jgi:DNA-binding beta-propeller fold protein YncE
MRFSVRLAQALLLLGWGAGPLQAQTIVTVASGFSRPAGIALDAAGNVFVADPYGGTVKEILAAGGYATVNALGNDFGPRPMRSRSTGTAISSLPMPRTTR